MKSKNIFDHFMDLTDPREDNKRHLLIDIIAIVICASICSAGSWEDIVIFGEAKKSWLRTFLKLPHGIPSKDTFRRVFASFLTNVCPASKMVLTPRKVISGLYSGLETGYLPGF